ncbi:MAG: carbon-nitrogen hydrolase family protein [Betaproteobacteria bacterium]|nr:carbon-nitrogen hydrolase family protein [Betaproteobacteria bacterium]
MQNSFRAACIQLEIGKDASANLAKCLAAAERAAAAGAQLIVLPELCNHPGPFDSRESAWAAAEPEGGPWAQAMAALARERGVTIAYNVLARGDRPYTFITTFVVDPRGERIAEYSKQFLFATQADWALPGRLPLPAVETPLGRIGIYICMDGLIPEPTRVLQLLGAQVLLNALNSAGPDEADLHVPARAAEVRAWVLSANKVGSLSAAHASVYAGGSSIVAPDGTVVARASDDKEETVYATITPALADDKSLDDGDDLVRDRRPETYGLLLEPNERFPSYKRDPAPEQVVRFATVQINAQSVDDERVLERVLKRVEEKAGEGAQVVVLPESFLWMPGAVASDPAAAVVRSIVARERLLDLCRRSKILLAANLIEAGEAGKRYNSVYLLGPGGELGRYRQVHVRAADRLWARTGDSFPVFDTPFGKFGLLLGYDGLFPEAARIVALQGASAILYPCNWRLAAEPRLIAIERAAENHLALIAANRSDSKVASGSRIISGARYPTRQHWKMRFPESTELAHGVEDALVAAIDLGAMAQKLVAYKTDLIADRMPEHYRILAS